MEQQAKQQIWCSTAHDPTPCVPIPEDSEGWLRCPACGARVRLDALATAKPDQPVTDQPRRFL
jgi:hypothetical protein